MSKERNGSRFNRKAALLAAAVAVGGLALSACGGSPEDPNKVEACPSSWAEHTNRLPITQEEFATSLDTATDELATQLPAVESHMNGYPIFSMAKNTQELQSFHAGSTVYNVVGISRGSGKDTTIVGETFNPTDPDTQIDEPREQTCTAGDPDNHTLYPTPVAAEAIHAMSLAHVPEATGLEALLSAK